MRVSPAIACFLAWAFSQTAFAQAPRPDQAAFRTLYKELVETNTTLSVGSCTLASERMAAHLKAAGYTDQDITLFSVPEHPKDGGLVAVLKGTDSKAKPLLLLAHLDVVEAKRADWTRDPFTLIEENGFYYARGASDDKAMAAIFTDTMVRLHAEPRARRTIKLALTCGEETTGAFNGAEWLSKNRRELIDAGFALNEGGGGRLDADGKPLALAMQVSEKTYQDYVLEARNPGGHSSMPRPDNAIYELSTALGKVQAFRFPVHLNPVTKAFFEKQAALVPPSLGQAMTAIAANPNDKLAETVLSRDPMLNSTLRTTCVATLIEGGHAQNALPQRATANVNCRIAPGESTEDVRKVLAGVVDDPAVTVTLKVAHGPVGQPAPLDPAVFRPAEALAAEMFPGLQIIPVMSTGASDSIFLSAAGIPSYGVPGILYEADGGGVHGLNEHIRVSSLMKGRDYLYRLVKVYAAAP
ncbi:M20/M25/M40 family metallo-hydrolase [Phenylobacterium sp.]|jgi:acetylornithine deacetylase/succinyl-diaminopimelate desuccinylase-like protein|uniref:M20/M25/M40 family metallo-hydrolase n=1 Tax=Phenylobacterium sp. TaxID=1871053 RepID=UPI002E34DE6D|nr:M20/M25/M40 family metallo-hydrolase [Phenylobacterium sp.]HEX4709798.1 M20/M25/M40 family metallo-hydrolase [Phenylobacterium sp.]